MTPTIDRSHIQGWGVDLDPADRPAVPKERKPPRLDPPPHWTTPEQQPQRVEILISTERPRITPAFGTTLPPSGLSGMIRRRAFHHSENNIRHWLMLIAADRVNVVEGMIADLRKPSRAACAALAIGSAVALTAWLLRRD
jgi:hypothetical protein